MKRFSLLCLWACVSCLLICGKSDADQWWKQWPEFPKGLRISAEQVKELVMRGEKTVFVYAGYEIDEGVCGSHVIPYIKVPPYADGSGVRVKIPKDWWVLCYCP